MRSQRATATRIRPPTHTYLENTLDSIQSLAFLRGLDIGHGYTADSRNTYPYRGRFPSAMPTFREILDRLDTRAEGPILVNFKDGSDKTLQTLAALLEALSPALRGRVLVEFYRHEREAAEFRPLSVPEAIYQGVCPIKRCVRDYMLFGWTGFFRATAMEPKCSFTSTKPWREFTLGSRTFAFAILCGAALPVLSSSGDGMEPRCMRPKSRRPKTSIMLSPYPSMGS